VKLAVYILPRFGHPARGRGPRPAAGQVGSGLRCPGLFGIVAGPQQAEHARAELGFGPEAI
jgi:hypothetical protein